MNRLFDTLFDTLAARLFLLLVIAAVATAGVALVVSDAAHRAHLAQLHDYATAERIGDLANAARRARGVNTADLATDLAESLPAARAALAGKPDPALTRAVASALDRRGVDGVKVAAYEASAEACGETAQAAERAAKTRRASPRCRILMLTSAGQDGQAIQLDPVAITLPAHPAPLISTTQGIGLLLFALAGVALASWAASRFAAGPLNRLSVAAVALGEDLDRPPLIEEGSREVREAAAAFNAMQHRLKAMLQDRTRVLAAIAHDLQTPLTRLRLRVEKVEDEALRDRLIADLAATQALVREGLELARIEDTPEPWAALDLDALLAALCDDAADAGQPVVFLGGCGQVIRARPNALRRCLSNLIDNAVKHGARAEVRCQTDDDAPLAQTCRITIRDHGPGIPEDQLDAVFEPFLRLETSRSRDSGGTGLGLTIAQRMAAQTGAKLTLSNAPGGGLEAVVALKL